MVVLSEGMPMYSHNEVAGRVAGVNREMALEGPEIVGD